MLLISERIDWYSWLAADNWDVFRVPFDASVASVIARFNRFVTCESAPSATCSIPTPSVALLADWLSALALACSPFTRESPAASSAPELMREPDDSCCNTVCRLLFVLFRLFPA